MSPPTLGRPWLAGPHGAGDPAVRLPGYNPADHGVGIVHLGVGAFHRAHQAVHTDAALQAGGGDWRILGVSLRSTTIADALNRQDGLYSVLLRDAAGTQARVIASIDRVLAARRSAPAVRAALADPRIRIVTLTVTEKAYGIDRATRGIQADHPAVAHDLAHPDAPEGVLGLLAHALRARRGQGTPPFAVVCCDNLPDNGRLLQAGVCDLAARWDRDLSAWIRDHVAFPGTMVDRITPAPTDRTRADAARLLGVADAAAVETEPFSMWVVEDAFPLGRPAWESAGVLMVRDVAPYEHMKLRMLNGAHSLLAYAGCVAGHVYVRDAVADPALAQAARALMTAAARTLQPLPGVSFPEYANELMARFANPAIAHETTQIAMDGTEKLPQRLLMPALECLNRGDDIRPFAFAVAAWMRYCLGVTDAGQSYALNDPRATALGAAAAQAAGDASALYAALAGLPGLFPEALRTAPRWRASVTGFLQTMLAGGMPAALGTLQAG